MDRDEAGGFTLALHTLATPFRYKVVAGPAASSTFDVSIVRAPRVARIDVEYTYPRAFGLGPRVEEDAGDVYAPAGTAVRLRIHTDVPALDELTAGAAISVPREADGLPARLAEAIDAVDGALAERLGTAAGDRARAFSWRDSAEKVWQLHADL